MSEQEELKMNAYYYGFEKTGVIEVDRILSAVARAGKSFHNTKDWDDKTIALIQTAAADAAKEIDLLNVRVDYLDDALDEYVSASQRLAIERAEFRQENERLKTPASLETERTRFENWMSQGGKWPRAIGKDLYGHYLLMQTASYWRAWRAATNQAEQ